MQQPTCGPQPVCQPFSRSQPAQWLLVRMAVLTLTLAGKHFSVLYAWTLLSTSAWPKASIRHAQPQASHSPSLCPHSAGSSCSHGCWTCPGGQGSCGGQCVPGRHGPWCSQKDGGAHRHVTPCTHCICLAHGKHGAKPPGCATCQQPQSHDVSTLP